MVRAPDSLREQVGRALRAAVVTGEMSPGVIYSAPALSTRYGVSATPVREALLELVRDGLVEPVRNKGFRVVEATDQELDDVAEVRELLEVPATVAAIEHADRLDFVALHTLVNEIEASALRADFPEYVENDRRFHHALLSTSGNEVLVNLIFTLRARTRLFGLPHLSGQGLLLRFAHEHREILQAIEARDADQTAALMRQHIGHTRAEWAGR